MTLLELLQAVTALDPAEREELRIFLEALDTPAVAGEDAQLTARVFNLHPHALIPSPDFDAPYTPAYRCPLRDLLKQLNKLFNGNSRLP